jgi:hypothetical protein
MANLPRTNSPHKGACHCGSVQFEVTLVDGLNTARRCTCSMCRMRGGIAVSANLRDLKITKGADKLSVYQFNTKTAKHFFCSVCGIYTHHQRRSNPEHYGISVACLEGISPFDLEEVPVLDGINHPRDTGQGEKGTVVGVLKYIKATA